jgi:putative pyoverdin transport system ATP-binding/permease protein
MIPPKSRFLSLLAGLAGPKLKFIVLMGLMSGFFEALSVVFINGAVGNISGGVENFRFLGLFLVSIGLYIVGDRYVLIQALRAVGRWIYDVQVRLVDKIRHVKLEHFEGLERSRVQSALMEHTEVIIEATRYLADGISNITMLLISSIYIASLSLKAFFVVITLQIVGLLLFLRTQKAVVNDLKKVRAMHGSFLAAAGQLLDGFKEVKLNTARSDDIFENHIAARSRKTRELKTAVEVRANCNFLHTRGFFFLLIAAVVFVLPQFEDLEMVTAASVVAVVLFSVAPLFQLILGIPFITKAEMAIAQLQELEQELDAAGENTERQPDAEPRPGVVFNSIRLEHMLYQYGDHGNGDAFTLGPVDLEIRQGELLILAGGNGSGKSTLLKILSGLYAPHSGALFLDDTHIGSHNLQNYRNLFSAVFTDFHLFDRLYGFVEVDQERLDGLLQTMQIAGRTSFREGRFTNLQLSSGQRKRLALAVASLEDKPVMLFDEAAAELDVEFRTYFYETYLHELRARGATLVVASHDDRFFHVADRVLRLEYGRIVMARNESPKGRA